MKQIILLAVVFSGFSVFASSTTTQIASCEAVVLSDKNFPQGSADLTGEKSSVVLNQWRELPYIDSLIMKSFGENDTASIRFHAVLGLPLAYDGSHESQLTDTDTDFHLEYCYKDFSQCVKVGTVDFDQQTHSGTVTTFTKHCEPQESCPTEEVVFSLKCDGALHVAR